MVGPLAGLKGAFAPDKVFADMKLVAFILEVAVAIKDVTTFVVQQTDLWEKAGVILQKQDSKLRFIEAKKPAVFQDLDVDRCVDIMGQNAGRPREFRAVRSRGQEEAKGWWSNSLPSDVPQCGIPHK